MEEATLAPRLFGDTGDDAALLTALRTAQFLPAVVKGKAAAGAGTFALGELVPGSGSE